jgi:predicted N-acyltransferase
VASSTKTESAKLGVRIEPTIAQVDAAAWDALDHGPSPFLRHGFLRALEESGSIGGTGRRRSGWTPAYLLAERGGALVGGVVAFVKDHSYGEYIFDWGWASAAQRAGIRYYPKLVIAAPATPATGKRILLARDADRDVTAALLAEVRAVADDTKCS